MSTTTEVPGAEFNGLLGERPSYAPLPEVKVGLLNLCLPSYDPKPAREPGPWPELENVLGLWRNPDGDELVGSFEGIDGLAYQRRIRSEWDR